MSRGWGEEAEPASTTATSAAAARAATIKDKSTKEKKLKVSPPHFGQSFPRDVFYCLPPC